jgi:hypothetical protein
VKANGIGYTIAYYDIAANTTVKNYSTHSWCHCCKAFFTAFLFSCKKNIRLWQTFQSGKVVVGKVRSKPQRFGSAKVCCWTWAGSSLAEKCKTTLKIIGGSNTLDYYSLASMTMKKKFF